MNKFLSPRDLYDLAPRAVIQIVDGNDVTGFPSAADVFFHTSGVGVSVEVVEVLDDFPLAERVKIPANALTTRALFDLSTECGFSQFPVFFRDCSKFGYFIVSDSVRVVNGRLLVDLSASWHRIL